jgi:hypothetical protein
MTIAAKPATSERPAPPSKPTAIQPGLPGSRRNQNGELIAALNV